MPKGEDHETKAVSIHSVPTCYMEDDDVEQAEFEYSIRHPDDWVISGPLGTHGAGPGRRFASWGAATRWARSFYDTRFKGRIAEAAVDGHNRWAFLIRGPRGSK